LVCVDEDADRGGLRVLQVVLAAVAGLRALRAGDLEDLDALELQTPRERDTIGAGAFDASAPNVPR
jgi:hypothetical protein